ncbi:hypothetical protein QT381_06525 [Galbitalea sp. SE-J8]|uniref:hypothetical protein n=1 Tax=Galbitalea sp. SE-J8 TaxID=3054952 RepID=UPI00259C6B26|nr:hypothetical protein [Galbitalea sp. SE-J8]MDM4762658.1 hypothetical protein [Galbitalea sp. SE-J8]
MTDPTFLRNQPALTTSSGRSWLIVGALFAVIAAGVLFALAGAPPAGVGLGGGIAVIALYAAMVVIRLAVPARRRRLRLGLLAGALLAMAAIGLVCVLVIATTAASELAG